MTACSSIHINMFGPHPIVVFGTADAPSCRAALQAAGIDADAPHTVQRIIEMPDEDVTLEFKNLHLPDDATPGLHTVVGQHLTMRPPRRRLRSCRSRPTTDCHNRCIRRGSPR